jgi:hypothetical protein
MIYTPCIHIHTSYTGTSCTSEFQNVIIFPSVNYFGLISVNMTSCTASCLPADQCCGQRWKRVLCGWRRGNSKGEGEMWPIQETFLVHLLLFEKPELGDKWVSIKEVTSNTSIKYL